jgi:Ran-binding protein 9/10
LEKVYAQTTVLLEDLRQDGGPGAFVSLKEIIDDIPKSQAF